ncbi:MAG: DUF389 domain-containing protein [Prochlorotrichaceae cyanobacterium]
MRWLKFRPNLHFSRTGPTEEDLNQLRQNLLEDGSPNPNFFVLIFSSCLIASFGLIGNSAAVIIGAMIIAPLMLPLRSLAFGALEGDLVLFRQSAISLICGTVIGITLSWGLGTIVDLPEFGSEVLARTRPNLIDLGIAIVAGMIAGYAKVQPKLSDALAGTAIAVALMPPLCVVGLTLSQGNLVASSGAFLLYLTNLLGISLACMVVFSLSGYIPTKQRKVRGILRLVVGLTLILVVPLAISFDRLVREARLKAEIKALLLRQTITVGQQVRLLLFEIDTHQTPVQIYLTVETDTPPTPLQVRLLEEFLWNRLERSFNLVFRVSEVIQVEAYAGPIYQDFSTPQVLPTRGLIDQTVPQGTPLQPIPTRSRPLPAPQVSNRIVPEQFLEPERTFAEPATPSPTIESSSFLELEQPETTPTLLPTFSPTPSLSPSSSPSVTPSLVPTPSSTNSPEASPPPSPEGDGDTEDSPVISPEVESTPSPAEASEEPVSEEEVSDSEPSPASSNPPASVEPKE